MKQFQSPARSVFNAGDCLKFRLETGRPAAGRAYLRTTIGSAAALRSEAIRLAESGCRPDSLAWRDLPMRETADGVFELTVPLLEVGTFEAKCCFQPADGGRLSWPDGENFRIKVECAAGVGANLIYCAFVRQFGGRDPAPADRELLERLDRQGYTVIPPSGTFRGLAARLDHIFGTLGCRILQLLPIHPAPTVFGRMGRFGSPFASLDYFEVDPALAEFDRSATPLEQFVELLDAVHARRGRLFLDIPVNHTGWASRLQLDHPEYFVRRDDGSFESPGAWGVVWADLCKLDYRRGEVCRLMAEVFLHWCRIGVDGFRCDAGYMVPAAAWDFIIARVREEYPDTVFLLEGLGGRPEVQEQLLRAGLDWAYSELFQNYHRDEIERCLTAAVRCGDTAGKLVHFAETHDNTRLAAVSAPYAAMRCALAALLSPAGAFGYANGVEFLASERIDVHGAAPLNWDSRENLIPLLRQLARLLALHPAFFAGGGLKLIQSGPGDLLAVLRRSAAGDAEVLVLVNLDCAHPATVRWPAAEFAARPAIDLLSGRRVEPTAAGETAACPLAPAEVLCLAAEPAAEWLPGGALPAEPPRVTAQRAQLAAGRVRRFFGGDGVPEPDDAEALCRDPLAFCRRAAGGDLPPVTVWRTAGDERRVVPLPPGELLLVTGREPFRVEVTGGTGMRRGAVSLPRRTPEEGEFALLELPDSDRMRRLELTLTVFDPRQGTRRSRGTLLQLAPGGTARYRFCYDAAEVRRRELCALLANRRGGMSLVRAAWGGLGSKYDALLAANGAAPYPADRRVMFTRCRIWLVADDYSQEVDLQSLRAFCAGTENRARWRFAVPVGRGRLAELTLELIGALDGDAVRLRLTRESARCDELRVILRPDLEDRCNHEVTKAYAGAETAYPAAVTPAADGLTFAPAPERVLTLRMPGSRFVVEPEWKYMVELPLERDYGLEHTTDLFSPGYLEWRPEPGESVELFAAVSGPGRAPRPADFEWPAEPASWPAEAEPEPVLRRALHAFIVRRDEFQTVIAGYPWFLDWGRDTLIALRGIIRAGERKIAADILRQFASFEENGTIPNIIHGDTVGNRDTSDAPLWLAVAARDYTDFFGDDSILDADCRGRSFRSVLHSIVDHYRTGTPNGIGMDAASALIFSPAHFTWMDTNYPAGTPREGYPVEIQALWQAALAFLGRRDPDCRKLAERAAVSLSRYFYRPELGFFSDCLHAAPGTPAERAEADDHLRCNQLLALTLGAVVRRAEQLAIVNSSAELLTPGAIRTLADRPVRFRLPVVRQGRLLNDPAAPYRGEYRGPEDTARKVAYHNGTAWGWPYASYCEALLLVGGEAARSRALALLDATVYLADAGIPGMLPEVADGDAPHRGGGCPAQAWSVSEAFRVYDLLQSGPEAGAGRTTADGDGC